MDNKNDSNLNDDFSGGMHGSKDMDSGSSSYGSRDMTSGVGGMNDNSDKNNSKDSAGNKVTINEVLNEQDEQTRNEKYNQYVKDKTPTHNWFLNMIRAFFVGGIICTIGQGLINLYISWGVNENLANAYNTLTLVFLSVLLTGFGVYPKLAKFAGAGTVVPITGFANSVAASAIEFKKEGQVFGIGCKIFTIAGPVILYGIFSSWIYGLIYYILMKLEIL